MTCSLISKNRLCKRSNVNYKNQLIISTKIDAFVDTDSSSFQRENSLLIFRVFFFLRRFQFDHSIIDRFIIMFKNCVILIIRNI